MIHHHVRSFGDNKIMAIKLVRELAACGLKEAKDIVEQQLGFFVSADDATQSRVAKDARAYGIEFDPPLGGTMSTTSTVATPEPGGYSVRYVSGSAQLIPAIKLVRELTGLGLKDAKDLVEQGNIVRSNLSRSEAEQMVRRFLEIGGQVEVLEPNASVSTSTFASSHRATHDYEKEDDYDF
jgi:large subunit ribosomal protein L7/L12